jgi:hypothetical protein
MSTVPRGSARKIRTRNLAVPQSRLAGLHELLDTLRADTVRSGIAAMGLSCSQSDSLLPWYRQVTRLIDGFELEHRYLHYLKDGNEQLVGSLLQLSSGHDLSEVALQLASGAVSLEQLRREGVIGQEDNLTRSWLYRSRVIRVVQLDRIGETAVRHLLVQVPAHEVTRLQQERELSEITPLGAFEMRELKRFYEQQQEGLCSTN